MNAVPELSGMDLARQALLAAREAAKTPAPRSRSGAPARLCGGTAASRSGWARQLA
ncbi:hypothetical protein ACWC98_32355 [Streptomyces goshikiensis]